MNVIKRVGCWMWLGIAALTAILLLPVSIADRAWLVDSDMWFGLPIFGSVVADVGVTLFSLAMWWWWTRP